jgi:hypothetical protein
MSNLATKSPNPELIDKKIGKLTVLSYIGYVDVGSQKVHKWKCRCDCGKLTDVPKQRLTKTDAVRSCGCYRGESIRKAAADRAGHPANDLINRQVGKLKVLELAGICPLSIGGAQIHYLWRCRCECGNEVSVRGASLTRRVRPRRSCGNCRKPKIAKFASKPRSVESRPRSTVPATPTKPKTPRAIPLVSSLAIPEMIEIVQSGFVAWLRSEYDSIYRRCNDEDNKYYHLFGGSGITLAWDDPDCFAEWVVKNLGSKPVGTKILRIDRYGNFEPGNIRYATF